MASRKDNIKSLFTNTRTRVIIVFTLVLLIIAVVVGYVKFRKPTYLNSSSSTLSSAPGSIQSIPGALNQTAQYSKLQEEQNINQALNAQKKGGSAIPTIIRTQALGEGVGVIGSTGGQSGVGFVTLSREDEEGAQRSLWIQELQNASCSKTAISKVMNEGGQLDDLKAACSCVQLKDSGFGLQDLEQICDCKELKAAGVNARQLKDAGYSAARLRICGFNACEERNAGFTAQEMKDGDFPDGELKGAGFSDDEIAKASGLPGTLTADDVRKSGCSKDALIKLRQAGVSAAAIRKITGCSVNQLKDAAYSPQDLKDAGFSAADLKKVGFSPAELKDGGYTARDLANAGYSPTDLANAGFSAAQIKGSQTELPPGITSDDVKKAGCDVDLLKKEMAAGVSANLIRQNAGCSAQALKATGFSNEDLTNAGFSPKEITAASPISDADIKAAGCDPVKLNKLLAAGVSAKQIIDINACNPKNLKNAGYDAQSLANAGVGSTQLMDAGFTPKQLEDAGLNPAAIIASGRSEDCTVDSLRKAKAAGVTALTIKQTLGCSTLALKNPGYAAKNLKDAGFTAAELKNAGFSADDLKNAGFTPKELINAGFDPQDLKNAGFTARDLKDAGLSVGELKKAGFTAAQLKTAGVTAKELSDAGFSLSDLKNAGFPESELKAQGLMPSESTVAGLQPPVLQQYPSNLANIPNLQGSSNASNANAATNNDQLQAILMKQNQQMAEQKYQQKIQQRTSDMTAAANQSIQDWKKISPQVYMASSVEEKAAAGQSMIVGTGMAVNAQPGVPELTNGNNKAVIKTGDILFAVMDTSINSDEPGPILATIVSGKLKGAKLIGSFNLPSNANKMVITFNTMSVPGAAKTISISAFAIDPNTARTALSSRTDHHYLMRYGSLFASSFIEGFGNAFQSADTTITIGGTGGGNNITVQNGIGRSTLENAVIGLATVGKAWGQQAQQLFNTPTTVEVFSGTGLGILFTQDVMTI